MKGFWTPLIGRPGIDQTGAITIPLGVQRYLEIYNKDQTLFTNFTSPEYGALMVKISAAGYIQWTLPIDGIGYRFGAAVDVLTDGIALGGFHNSLFISSYIISYP
jgi:hypothetical protein